MAEFKEVEKWGVTYAYRFKLTSSEVESVKTAGDLVAILLAAVDIAVPGLGKLLTISAKVWLWQLKRINEEHGKRGVVLETYPILSVVPVVRAPSAWP
jgi:hypothetical protein